MARDWRTNKTTGTPFPLPAGAKEIPSGVKGAFPLGVAEATAKGIVRSLRPHFERLEIVGSIRRRKPFVGDIDIIGIPDFETDRERVTWIDPETGIQVNLWYTTPEGWGAAELAYTGPQGWVIGMRALAKRKGLLLNEKGLFKNGRRIAGKTEEEIGAALKHEIRDPTVRGTKH